MTTMTVVSVSPDSFLASTDEPSFVDLPEAVELPPDNTEQISTPAGICPVCGEVIERRPGQRGRLAKYHEECRPTRGSGKSTPITGQPRAIRVSKAELVAAEETEAIIQFLNTKLTQAAMLLALIEPYDALVIRINTPELLNNLRPVLMQFPKLRAVAGATQVGGSLFGLIIAIATTILPIAAHHNMVPVKKVSKFLVQLPMVMLRIQQRMAEGNEEGLTEDLFNKVKDRVIAERNARMRAQQEETDGLVDASDAA